MIQRLVSNGHTLFDVKHMTLKQIESYNTAINDLQKENSLMELYVQRTAAHAEADAFKKMESSLGKKPVATSVDDMMNKDWIKNAENSP